MAAVAVDRNSKEKNKTQKTASSNLNDAVANANHLSNQKPNKDSESALIDASESDDALISDRKRDTDAAVTDRLAAVNESQVGKDSIQANQDPNAIEEAIALANDKKTIEKEEDEKLNRWSVSPNVAPVYFNSLGKSGSSLDNQFNNNAKEGDVNMSYGVAGSYAVNKKLKIRAGVNRVDLGYRTNNVIVLDGSNSDISSASVSSSPSNYNDVQIQKLRNIRLEDNYVNDAFLSASSRSFASAPGILFTKEQSALDQNIGFIEVPIEIEYSLINKKIGVNVIGGFSTLFLSNNEIYTVQNNGNSTLLGEATNINDMSYSANFGLGLNYNISKQFRFNLEPTFKYQINTFSNTSGDFKPFFMGLYTGLSFKF